MKDQECYCNRELSWLKFNERVLDEAGYQRTPLGERLLFASIYQTNLDEFYMVRVGSLIDQAQSGLIVRDNKTNMTSAEQVKRIIEATKALEKKRGEIYSGLMGELDKIGIRLVTIKKLPKKEEAILQKIFEREVAPFLSPMVVGKQQPFPFLRGEELYAVLLLAGKNGKPKMGVIPCSSTVFKRLIEIPDMPGNFVLSEELILHFAPTLFGKYQVKEKSIIRVTRNADIDTIGLYDEDLDYRDAMEHLIKQRKRLAPVRLELSRNMNSRIIGDLCAYLKLPKEHVFVSRVPLDMGFVFPLRDYIAAQKGNEKYFYDRRSPRLSPAVDYSKPMIPQIEAKDLFLSFPFESIKPFIDLLHQAAFDPTVVSIKMTLYRLAKNSKIVEELAQAAENGKEVVVLVELRARFDEESNINYSKVLEDAGCQVIYGLDKYKVHSKLCLITRKTDEGVKTITQIGTGNYNEKTTRMYTDLSVITADDEIGRDAMKVFNALLMDETVESVEKLLVSPHCLQNKVLEMIDDEIAYAAKGEPAYLGIKMNSLTDKVIIDKLIEASKAGVKIDMVIRGICCLVPGIAGKTDNIRVFSIVGRFLEHSRIYRFGTPEREKVYIASADYMTRNTEKRVEVAAPILDPDNRARVDHIFELLLKDTWNGRELKANGHYDSRLTTEKNYDSQAIFYEEAYQNEKKFS